MEKDSLNVPKNYTAKLYVSLGLGKFNHGRIQVEQYNTAERSSEGFEAMALKTIDIDIDLSNCAVNKKNATAVYVKTLEAQKQQIQADAHVRIKDLDDKIKDLLAIEHNAGE